MNKIIQIVILLVLLTANRLFAQDDVIQGVHFHIKNINSRDLTRYMNDIIVLNLDGEKGNYTRTQAEFILKDFFKKCPPADYQKIHQGNTPQGFIYAIGRYSCIEGSYKVYFEVKIIKGSYLVDKLEFIRE